MWYNISFGNDNYANDEIENNKNNTLIVIGKNQRMLKINKIVKSVCFYVIPNMHFSVKSFFHAYMWQPSPRCQIQFMYLQIK